jgi:hypothetical protein
VPACRMWWMISWPRTAPATCGSVFSAVDLFPDGGVGSDVSDVLRLPLDRSIDTVRGCLATASSCCAGLGDGRDEASGTASGDCVGRGSGGTKDLHTPSVGAAEPTDGGMHDAVAHVVGDME